MLVVHHRDAGGRVIPVSAGLGPRKTGPIILKKSFSGLWFGMACVEEACAAESIFGCGSDLREVQKLRSGNVEDEL